MFGNEALNSPRTYTIECADRLIALIFIWRWYCVLVANRAVCGKLLGMREAVLLKINPVLSGAGGCCSDVCWYWWLLDRGEGWMEMEPPDRYRLCVCAACQEAYSKLLEQEACSTGCASQPAEPEIKRRKVRLSVVSLWGCAVVLTSLSNSIKLLSAWSAAQGSDQPAQAHLCNGCRV